MPDPVSIAPTLATDGTLRPVPDPTVLTTQQLWREVAIVRELIETRLDGMDKAIELLQKTTDKQPNFIESQIMQLQRLHEEKFRSVAIQFVERDTRTEQTSRDSKVAVDAALQAAKEAVGEQNKSSAMAIAKSEAATTKQIDQIGVIIQTNTAGFNDKIDDIKSRLTIIEGKATGAGNLWGIIVGVAGLVSAAAVIISILIMKGH
jgi:Fe2+ transport system protein B